MRNVILVICMLILSIGYAQERRIEFEEYDLENGLHIILHQDNTTPIVNVSVFYHVGSKNEPKGKSGFAHFFEHLMFEGSKNVKRGEFDKILDKAGGTNNATTDFDRTLYYETVPSHQLEIALYLESERMLHPVIDSVGIATQREVVKEEKRLRIDNQPYGSVLEETMSRVFKGTAYSWTPIGTFDDINAATQADFQDFFDTFYVPNNATLAIAGDIDLADAKAKVEKWFGEIPRGTHEVPRPVVEMQETGLVTAEIFDNIQLPAVIHAYQMAEQGSEDYYALEMLTTLLSGGQSSRFQKEIVDNQQIAVQVASFPLALEDAGTFIAFGLVNVGIDPTELSTAMDNEIMRVKEEEIGDQEFQKLRNQIENAFISSNSTMAGVAESLADYHVYYGDANLINSEIERYMAVTKADLKRVANKYLNPTNRVELTYLPKSAQQQPEGEEIKDNE